MKVETVKRRVQTVAGVDRIFTVVFDPRLLQEASVRGAWFLIHKANLDVAQGYLDILEEIAKRAAAEDITAFEFLREVDYRKGQYVEDVVKQLSKVLFHE